MVTSSIPLMDIAAIAEKRFRARLSMTPTGGNPRKPYVFLLRESLLSHPVLSSHRKNDGSIISIWILQAALLISQHCKTMRRMLCLVNRRLLTSLQSFAMCMDFPVNPSKVLLISTNYIPRLSKTISSRTVSSASLTVPEPLKLLP